MIGFKSKTFRKAWSIFCMVKEDWYLSPRRQYSIFEGCTYKQPHEGR